MGVLDRCRHQRLSLRGRIAEHDPLIASALVLILGRIDALGDMGRLLVQQIGDLAGRVVELVLFIADILDTGARDILDPAHIILQPGLVRQPHFAADHHAVGRGKGFAGNTRLGFLCQKCIKDRIRDPIADLVRVSLGNGFRCKDIVIACHGDVLR